jgi:hypothetical protein
MPPTLHHRLKNRGARRLGAGVALLAVVAVVVGIATQTGSSPAKRNSGGKDSAYVATTVKRRDLVQTDTESGTLSYASAQTVYNRLSGTLTWLPTIGQVIKPGQALFKVDGKPVILMNGTTPAYRDLSPSDSAGQDIEELNRNLVALGFNPDGIVVDDQWQAATTAGVEAFQASIGETQTGSLTLGQVVFLPGDQLVSTLDATLGSTGSSSGGGNPSGSSNATDTSLGARPEFVDLKNPPSANHGSGHGHGTGNGAGNGSGNGAGSGGQQGNGGQQGAGNGAHHGGGNGGQPSGNNSMSSLRALIRQLQAEVAALRAANGPHGGGNGGHGSNNGNHGSNSGNHGSNNGNASGNGATPASNGSNQGGSGSGSGSATAVIETTSTKQIVTVDLDASKQSEAKVGERVTVEMPAGNTVHGRVSAVSSVAQSSSGSGSGNGNNGSGSGNGNGNGNNGNSGSSGSTVPVTITLAHPHAGAGLDQAAVSVNFAQARANHVLSVPVTALLATGGGGYAVQAAAAPHQLIPVTTGLFAAGYVQISGQGIHPGLQVTDSQG